MTTNVDSHLHNAGGTPNNDGPEREGDEPKRSVRGAASGIYIGPARIDAGDSNTAHATGAAAGGVDGSTGYRKRNGYFADGDATGGGQGGGTAVVRPTGRTFYSGDGVQGGSTPGRPIASGSDHLNTGNFDKRSSIAGDGGVALGNAGRGTSYKRALAADPLGLGAVTAGITKNSRVGVGAVLIPRPAIQATHNPAAGTVCIGTGGAAGLLVDLHADDVTSGANGLAGMEVFVYARGTDTDTDGGLVTKFDVDSATEADVSTGLAAGTTYAVYARFKDAAGNVGPMSARATATTT